MQIGAAIKRARQQRGWTQSDLSHFSRLSPGDISRIETGRLTPTPNQVERLSRALGIQPQTDEQLTVTAG